MSGLGLNRQLDTSVDIGRVTRMVLEVILLGLLAFAVWYMWPQSLGGGQQMVAVNGHSMEPTYGTGDLLIVRPNRSPEIGDILVYRIPDGEPGEGSMVVHRIIGFRTDGSIVTQGDNRDTADSFRVTNEDVVGSPVVVLPWGARLINVVGTPLGLGLIAGALMTLLLWPERKPEEIADAEGAVDDGSVDELSRTPDFDVYMADAEAWVERELAKLEWTQQGVESGELPGREVWVGRDLDDADEWVALELAGALPPPVREHSPALAPSMRN